MKSVYFKLKHILILLLINLCSGYLFGQVTSTIIQIGDISNENTTDSEIGNDGSILVAGNISNQISLGNNYLNYSGGYITKFDSLGQNQWIIRAGNYGINFPFSEFYCSPEIAIDSNNNIFVCGYFSDTSYIGNSVIVDTLSTSNCFLANVDPNGATNWVRSISSNTHIHDIELDINGNILLTGYFIGILAIDGDTIMSQDGDVLVMKFSNSGNLMWMKKAGGQSSYAEIGRDVDVDIDGNIYISGVLRSINPSFDSIILPVISTGGHKGFIAKYDPFGNVCWAKLCGYESYAVSCDLFGNVYAGGYVFGLTEFDSLYIGGPGGWSFFIAKFNSSGFINYVKFPYSNTGSQIRSLTTDMLGNCYAVGIAIDTLKIAGTLDSLAIINTTCSTMSQHGFYLKVDSVGNPIYGNSLKGCGPSSILNEVKLKNCKSALSGRFSYSPPAIYFNNDSLISMGGMDGIVIILDSCNISSGSFETQTNNEFIIFPNPVSSTVNFQLIDKTIKKITIINLIGQCVFDQFTFSKNIEIDMRKMQDGPYFYKLTDEDGQEYQGKFVKQL